MSTFTLLDDQGFQQRMDPIFYPLAAAVAREVRGLDRAKMQGVGVRFVEQMPAPAACRFDLNDIYLNSKYWNRVDPTEVGTPDWYEKYAHVAGAFLHEFFHWLFSNHNFDAWARAGLSTHREISTRVSMEEPRIEVRGWSRLTPMQRAAMKATMLHIVIRSFDPTDMDTASAVSQMAWLIWARDLNNTIPHDDQQVLETVENLEALFGAKSSRLLEVQAFVRHVPKVTHSKGLTPEMVRLWLSYVDDLKLDPGTPPQPGTYQDPAAPPPNAMPSDDPQSGDGDPQPGDDDSKEESDGQGESNDDPDAGQEGAGGSDESGDPSDSDGKPGDEPGDDPGDSDESGGKPGDEPGDDPGDSDESGGKPGDEPGDEPGDGNEPGDGDGEDPTTDAGDRESENSSDATDAGRGKGRDISPQEKAAQDLLNKAKDMAKKQLNLDDWTPPDDSNLKSVARQVRKAKAGATVERQRRLAEARKEWF